VAAAWVVLCAGGRLRSSHREDELVLASLHLGVGRERIHERALLARAQRLAVALLLKIKALRWRKGVGGGGGPAGGTAARAARDGRAGALSFLPVEAEAMWPLI
jgi:hypothetical protein